MNPNDIIYSICVEDIQNEAKIEIGRELIDDELSEFIKLLQYGLGENMILMYRNIFNEIL
jgi:hypothetical protein